MSDVTFLLNNNWRIANDIHGGWYAPYAGHGVLTTQEALDLQRKWDAEDKEPPPALPPANEQLEKDIDTLKKCCVGYIESPRIDDSGYIVYDKFLCENHSPQAAMARLILHLLGK